MHNMHNRSIMEDIMYLEYVCNDGIDVTGGRFFLVCIVYYA